MDPLDGYVEIDGRRISGAPEKIKKQIRGKIGFMFQQGALFDSLSVDVYKRQSNRSTMSEYRASRDSASSAWAARRSPSNRKGRMTTLTT